MEFFFEPDVECRPGFVMDRCRECNSAASVSFSDVAVTARLRARGYKVTGSPMTCGMCSGFQLSRLGGGKP